MTILGLSGLLNDPACAVLRDGKLAAAIEQNKIARHWEAGELPREAIAAALELATVAPDQVDCVALVRPFSSGPESALHLALRGEFSNARLVLVEHHSAHAASAFFAAPFDRATVLTLDRHGDFRCGARWRAEGTRIELEKELFFPDSLGDLYGRVTDLLGFHHNSDEHKVQWLATAGGAQFVPLFTEILGLMNSDWPRLDATFFDASRLRDGGFSSKFYAKVGMEDGARIPNSLRPALAAGLQLAIEAAVSKMAGDAENLCLAGGLGFNALLIAALERSRNVFVQPSAGNAGSAIGAVLYAWHSVYRESRRVPFETLCLGPGYNAEAIKKVLENCKLRFHYLQTADELIAAAVRQLSDQKIVAWMQGRMEFGPRALGNRSILASPLNPYSTENLNLYIKHREPFRKFAASVPAELAGEYFETGPNARFLATVGRVKPAHRATFQSAILGDDLVRVHTVSRAENPLFHRLLHAAGQASGLPVLYNTSFNLFGDPLVCAPRDAVRSFYSSGIDVLFAGNFLLEK
ncbi:MAG TPA: carbamoyltransferase C-terminal domain-containing protein [Bryobacteraceae bacterium]|nr:carbamoyltransferase C-terminal domain-containing protein [Bryobacteraceae bacterium]